MTDDLTIDPKRTYSIGTAARVLGISVSTMRNLEQRGQLEALRTPGGQRRFRGAELLRAQKVSLSGATKTRPTVPPTAPDADAKRRPAWLAAWIARAQRELPADTPDDVRFQLVTDLERAFRTIGPESPGPAEELLFKSVVDRAGQRAEDAREAAVRSAMKAELIDDALAHLRRKIDTLPRRLVGAPASFERTHIRASLRDQFRDALERRLRGDETWAEVRERADEFLAAWYVEQALGTRVPNAMKLIAAAAAGVAGGATAAAALDPRIRAAVAKFKDPLRSLVVDALNRIIHPPSSPSPPSAQPDPPAPAPPPGRRGAGVFGLHPPGYRPDRRFSGTTHRPQASASDITPSNRPPAQSGLANGKPGADAFGGPPGLTQ